MKLHESDHRIRFMFAHIVVIPKRVAACLCRPHTYSQSARVRTSAPRRGPLSFASAAASCSHHPPHRPHSSPHQLTKLSHLRINALPSTTRFDTNTPLKGVTMPDKTIPATSTAHFEKLISSASYNIVDFYADWCGPCKTIAPVFHSLAEKEAQPGRVQFIKVNVDNLQDVAKKYGVSA